MDGFYVAKIVKLSDRRPEDTLEEGEADADAAVEGAGEEAKTASKEKQKSHKKGGPKKKRKEAPTDDKEASGKPLKLSVPPAHAKPKDKKQKTNAKVTKPRRKRAATDA